jgi:hypothetical protein
VLTADAFFVRLNSMMTTLRLARECSEKMLTDVKHEHATLLNLEAMMPYNHPASISTLRLVQAAADFVDYIYCGEKGVLRGVHVTDYEELQVKAGRVLRHLVQTLTDYNLSAGEVAVRDLGALIEETTKRK